MAFFGYNKAGNEEKAVELPVTFIQDGDSVVAYTPALDLSTAGKDVEDAKKMFDEVVRIFFNDLVENNTVDEVLGSLGWTRLPEKSTWEPPKFTQESIGVHIPIAA